MSLQASASGLCLAVLLAGCAAAPPQQDKPRPAPGSGANLSGYPPQFREGYKDGCASVRGSRVRNESRFRDDAQYASGWRDGFDICSRQKR